MACIGMDQSAGDEAVPLILFGNCRRIKNEVVNYFLIAKAADGNQGRYDDNDDGDIQVHKNYTNLRE